MDAAGQGVYGYSPVHVLRLLWCGRCRIKMTAGRSRSVVAGGRFFFFFLLVGWLVTAADRQVATMTMPLKRKGYK